MEKYVGGDSVAFDELYKRLAPKVLGFLVRLTRDRPRAEDLLQVTFSKLHRARGAYLPGAPVLPWAFAIARRSFYDERRRAKARREVLSNDGRLPDTHAAEAPAALELEDALENGLETLPATYREAIELTKVAGLSVAEAAGVLGTTANAVKLRVHRGYRLLRPHLERFVRTR